MDGLSVKIGNNIRKYRKLSGLILERLAEILDTEPNYLGQCERGERRLSLDKLVVLMEYFGITANDILPVEPGNRDRQKRAYIERISQILDECSDHQLAVILNMLSDVVPFLKE